MDNITNEKETFDNLEQIEIETDDISQKIENKNANNNIPDKISVTIKR